MQHMHEHQLVHGDCKPKNCMRRRRKELGEARTEWMLIDLDAVVCEGEATGLKYSEAYIPPEYMEQLIEHRTASRGRPAEGHPTITT